MKEFYKVLHELGFRRTDRTRDLFRYIKRYPDIGVEVCVQLWKDGHHRASAMRPGLSGPYAYCDQEPTGFTDVAGMVNAIFVQKNLKSKKDKDWGKDLEILHSLRTKPSDDTADSFGAQRRRSEER